MHDFLTVEQLSKRLDCDPRSLYEWRRLRRNPLPAHRVVGRIYFCLDEVERWLKSRPDSAVPRKPRRRVSVRKAVEA